MNNLGGIVYLTLWDQKVSPRPMIPHEDDPPRKKHLENCQNILEGLWGNVMILG